MRNQQAERGLSRQTLTGPHPWGWLFVFGSRKSKGNFPWKSKGNFPVERTLESTWCDRVSNSLLPTCCSRTTGDILSLVTWDRELFLISRVTIICILSHLHISSSKIIVSLHYLTITCRARHFRVSFVFFGRFCRRLTLWNTFDAEILSDTAVQSDQFAPTVRSGSTSFRAVISSSI
jgi:hypothetical protein